MAIKPTMATTIKTVKNNRLHIIKLPHLSLYQNGRHCYSVSNSSDGCSNCKKSIFAQMHTPVVHILLDLRDQRLDTIKFHLAAQALDKLKMKRLPINIAFKV